MVGFIPGCIVPAVRTARPNMRGSTATQMELLTQRGVMLCACDTIAPLQCLPDMHLPYRQQDDRIFRTMLTAKTPAAGLAKSVCGFGQGGCHCSCMRRA